MGKRETGKLYHTRETVCFVGKIGLGIYTLYYYCIFLISPFPNYVLFLFFIVKKRKKKPKGKEKEERKGKKGGKRWKKKKGWKREMVGKEVFLLYCILRKQGCIFFISPFPKYVFFCEKNKEETKWKRKKGKEREKVEKRKKVGKEGFFKYFIFRILRKQGCIFFISPFPKYVFFVKNKKRF